MCTQQPTMGYAVVESHFPIPLGFVPLRSRRGSKRTRLHLARRGEITPRWPSRMIAPRSLDRRALTALNPARETFSSS